jgi:hypothetical protein
MQNVDVLSLGSAELPVIVFLTKIDGCEPGLVEDLGHTFHSQKLYKLVQVRTSQQVTLQLQAVVVICQRLSAKALLQSHPTSLDDRRSHRVRQGPTLRTKQS